MNMSQIAKLAGVSIATVSRTFRAPEKVRPELRKRVMEICEQYDYVYNAAAGDLSRNRTNIIGVLVPSANKSVFGETIMAIQEGCDEIGFATITGTTLYDESLEKKLLRRFQERRVAGIIFTGFTIGSEDLIYNLVKHDIACVIIWEILNAPDINYVGFDNFKAAYQATDHLARLGHRRIGLIIGPYGKVGRVKKRFEGYKKALADHSIAFDQSIIVSTEPFLHEGKQAMSQILSMQNPPTAVFAASDRLAIGALAAVKEKGLSVPKDISIMGFDDVEFAPYCDPPLSTIRVPAKEIGTMAVKVLNETIAGSDKNIKQYCLDFELIIRGSTAEPNRKI
jgi:DNA-binding LacI/PurR family transcriptional regulator